MDVKSKLIVVLGMHRSGTSAITRSLQVLGSELGNNLMPALEGNNDKGFWEDNDIVVFNDEILKVLNNSWHHLTPIKPDDVVFLHENGYLQRALDLVYQKVDDSLIFSFKDPRTAKLLPFWKEVFHRCKYEINYVLAIRNPLSVIQSLAKRDYFDHHQSYFLWLSYVLTGLIYSQGRRRIIVDYDNLMASPQQELTRIAAYFELEINKQALQEYIEFLDESLRHTTYNLDDLNKDTHCPEIIKDIFSVLQRSANDKIAIDDAVLQEKLVYWIEEFNQLNPTLSLIDKLSEKTDMLSKEVANAKYSIANLNQSIIERDAVIANLNQSMKERDAIITNINETIVKSEALITERDIELNTIRNSKSWKITAPLRSINSLFYNHTNK